MTNSSIFRLRRAAVTGVIALVSTSAGAVAASAQRPTLARAVRDFVAVDTSIVALTHVRVIDGTGAAPRADQTVIIRDGNIAAIGPAASTPAPAGAQVMDLTGKSVIPGLVLVHEHLFYPSGPGVYGNDYVSFTRLYLAGGVTSMRTAGNVGGYGDLRVAAAIKAGEMPGPWIDATAPYVQGPSDFSQMYALKDSADARRYVNFWADAGATSFKAYMNITRAALGIDNLEHGFFVATDFVRDKKPDVCPGQNVGAAAMDTVAPDGATFDALMRDLIAHHVAITSTLTVFQTFTPGQPMPRGLEVLDPILRKQFEDFYAQLQHAPSSAFGKAFARDRAMELRFARAGGVLLAGTDPTGAGGVIPGFADQRQIELLVGSGFTPLEAIRICTLNGATYLGRADRIGSIARGKQADLVVVRGNPAANIDDVENAELVFKQGVGYDPKKLIASVAGKVGLF